MSALPFHRSPRSGIYRTMLLSLLIAGIMSIGAASHASASSISYKGIILTPAVVNLSLLKGQQQATFPISVTNNTQTNQTLYLSTLDFRSLNETGGVAFVGNNANQLTHKYGLASWIGISKAPIDLPPHATKDVTVTIDNRSDLAPGGHYAAVLFKASALDPGSGTNHVAINQVVSTLVFVSKVDGARYGVKLVKTSLDRNLLHLPNTADVVFQNTGNIQAVPRGIVTVTSPFSREVSRGIINTDSNLVLPDSRRLYQVKLSPTGKARWPGIYHLTIQYRYDGTTTVQQANVSFWYVSPLWIGIIALIVLVTGYAVYSRAAIRRFFRHRSREKRGSK